MPGHDQLEDDQGKAEPEEDEGEVRIEQPVEEPDAGRHRDVVDHRVVGVQGGRDPVRDDDVHPVDACQHLLLGVGDQVDDVPVESLLRRDALRLRDERLGELRVASSLLGELPHRRCRVLLDLPGERHPADPDGRGGAHMVAGAMAAT